ncbi:MAG TPA: TetR/AcrR family transcriptional regulator [Solirubrobacteraceae bacterium]|jgi:AcrR family transcriptional regulator|nr:TetR/AcrR family transcriptional regulator [Solirubrobacteraceae bacterium]
MPERNIERVAAVGTLGGDPVLDAARATVLDFGVRRATLTEVARRAGLSRMTVYRRYSDGNELMRALMSREFGAVLLEAQRQASDLGDPLERVLAGITGTLRMLMEHPLMARLLEIEPEMLLPYLTERVGEFQRAGRRALAEWIAEAQHEDAIRAGDPAALAASIELSVRGLVLSARTRSPEETEAALKEAGRMIRGYLAPDSR